MVLLGLRLCCPLPAHVAECCEDLVWCWIGGENGSGVAWRIPGIATSVRKAGGGCSHATSERFFNSYVLVTGGGGKGCSLATSETTKARIYLVKRSWVYKQMRTTKVNKVK